jgi:intracellular sulfur oxidation DsrE/DsrF family protein
MDIHYAPQKVVYDVSTDSVQVLKGVLDRASYLSRIYNADPFDAAIVLVLHGPEINFFARKNTAKYQALMQRARSLTVGGIIRIRMCKIAAQGLGYKPEDIHGFVELVPMGDAEIIRLQTEQGYAYMR